VKPAKASRKAAGSKAPAAVKGKIKARVKAAPKVRPEPEADASGFSGPDALKQYLAEIRAGPGAATWPRARPWSARTCAWWSMWPNASKGAVWPWGT
jgi:hypothetical protein